MIMDKLLQSIFRLDNYGQIKDCKSPAVSLAGAGTPLT